MGRFEHIFPEKTEAICETTLLPFSPYPQTIQQALQQSFGAMPLK